MYACMYVYVCMYVCISCYAESAIWDSLAYECDAYEEQCHCSDRAGWLVPEVKMVTELIKTKGAHKNKS